MASKDSITAEVRHEVVRRYKETDDTVREIVESLDITNNQFYAILADAGVKGRQARGNASKEVLAALRDAWRENDELRAKVAEQEVVIEHLERRVHP